MLVAITVLLCDGGNNWHTCYSYKQVICPYINTNYHLIHAGSLELDLLNVLNVLREAGFADAGWAELGLQLIDHFDLSTTKADHGQANLCMIETISHWLKSDLEASWEKLADAIPKVRGYGEAIATIVRRTCMFYA